MNVLTYELRLFFVALQFLTRFPTPAWVGYRDEWLNRCVRYFPVVGALVGGVGAAIAVVAANVWTPPVAAALALASTVWITGAFHEDGLADTSDALLGQVSRERALEIMKDSRIGTYGSVALVLSLAMRWSLVTAMIESSVAFAAVALVASHAAGRAAAVVLSAVLPYGGDEAHAKAKPLARHVHRGDAVCAVMLATLPLALACALRRPHDAVVLMAGAGLVAAVVVARARRVLQRRLGGYTGDALGAAEQAVEVGVLLALAVRA